MLAENYTSVTEKATGWKGQFKTKNPFNLRLDKKKKKKKNRDINQRWNIEAFKKK